MCAERLARLFLPTIIAAAALMSAAPPSASAQPCPDIAVAFARGTGEQPGLGTTGQAFVDALRAQAGGRTVGAHGVNYPASTNFVSGAEFTRNIVDGMRDAANHVQGVSAVCPDARLILGGYSQGGRGGLCHVRRRPRRRPR